MEQGNSPDEIKMIIIQLLQSETQREVMRNAGLKWRKEQGSPTLNAYKELQKYLA